MQSRDVHKAHGTGRYWTASSVAERCVNAPLGLCRYVAVRVPHARCRSQKFCGRTVAATHDIVPLNRIHHAEQGRSQGARYRAILDGIVRCRAVCERSFRAVQLRCRAGAACTMSFAEIELSSISVVVPLRQRTTSCGMRYTRRKINACNYSRCTGRLTGRRRAASSRAYGRCVNAAKLNSTCDYWR